MLSPRRKEQRRIARLTHKARPQAYAEARGLCSTVGPARIAEEYGAPLGASAEQIADAYALVAFREQARDAARAGALDGFREYAA